MTSWETSATATATARRSIAQPRSTWSPTKPTWGPSRRSASCWIVSSSCSAMCYSTSGNKDLGKTPLRHFAEILDRDVFKVVSDPTYSAFDVLGNFYGELVKLGGSDGISLGIVLTTLHINDLLANMIYVNNAVVLL